MNLSQPTRVRPASARATCSARPCRLRAPYSGAASAALAAATGARAARPDETTDVAWLLTQTRSLYGELLHGLRHIGAARPSSPCRAGGSSPGFGTPWPSSASSRTP